MYRDIWHELNSEDSTAGYAVRRIAEASPRDIFLAIRNPGQERRLLLCFGAVDAPDGLSAVDLRGVILRVGTSPYRPDMYRTAVELTLSQRTYESIFDALVADLVAMANSVDGEADAIRVVFGRLRAWQRLLERTPVEGLGPERQRGLYGELWVLKNLIAPTVGFSAAIESWSGPMGTDQDFQYAGFAGEVKTTISHNPQRIRISSERQLDPTGIDRLALIHLSLDARQGSGETLPDLVETVWDAALASGTLEEFQQRLFLADYLSIHAERYGETGYTLRDHNILNVAGEFPRIIESDVSPGIGDVHYSIAISACLEYRISNEDFQGFLTGGTDG